MDPRAGWSPQVLASSLPRDALVLLVGPAGAGKSTFAAGRFKPHEVLSSDAFRELVSGDATDQRATPDAFRVLHAVARARLRRGLLTVVDATNLTPRARGTLLRLAAAEGRHAVAIVFDLSRERCLEQNAARLSGRVPELVVRRHHRQLGASLRSLPGEGLWAIYTLGDGDLPDREVDVRITRSIRRAGPPRRATMSRCPEP